MTKRISRGAVLAAFAGGLLGSPLAFAETPKTVQVDCSIPGKTIAKALEKGKEDRTLIVVVNGTCNENVVIDRADVTLLGLTGASIIGPDALLNTIQITADRVTIDNLVVSGGRNGITITGAGGAAIRGTTVQSTGRSGVAVLAGSGAIIDGSTLQSNPRDGVVIEGSQGTIINSTVRQNSRFGVFISTAASGRVGLDGQNNAAGNTITLNGANGVQISFGSGAFVANNSITLNGQDLASTSGRSGISVVQATADISGSNTIADNTGQGIFVRAGTVQIGNPSFDFSTVNTITGNGDALAAGGVFAFLGSSVVIRDAVISGNRGFGVGFTLRSQGQLFNTQVLDSVPAGTNAGDGIRLALGGGVLFGAPASTSSGNAGSGLFCTDPESSASNTPLVVLTGNVIPGTNCSGF